MRIVIGATGARAVKIAVNAVIAAMMAIVVTAATRAEAGALTITPNPLTPIKYLVVIDDENEDNWNLGRLGDPQSFDLRANPINGMFNFKTQPGPGLTLDPDTGAIVGYAP